MSENLPPARIGRREVIAGLTATAVAPFVHESEAAPKLKQATRLVENPTAELVPEFNKELKVGLISIGATPEHVEDYEQIIGRMPAGSRLFAVVYDDARARAFAQTLFKRIHSRSKDIEINAQYSTSQQDDYWGRDFGISILREGVRPVFVMSSSKTWEREPLEESDVSYAKERLARTAFLRQHGIEIVEAPFPFEGGNIFFDGQGRVLIGYDVLFTRISDDEESEVYATNPQKTALRAAVERTLIADRKERVRKFFNAKEAIVLGDKRQSLLYHADLSILPLPNNTMMITWFDDAYLTQVISDPLRRKDRDTLVEQQRVIKRQLEAAGYRVVLNIHTTKDIESGRIGVGAIPYRVGAEHRVLVPVFRDERVPYGTNNDEYPHGYEYQDSDLVPEASARTTAHSLRALGLTPLYVATSGMGLAATHCMLNQLAQSVGKENQSQGFMRGQAFRPRKKKKGAAVRRTP